MAVPIEYTEGDILEGLKMARQRIEIANDDGDGDVVWEFSDWTTCTCGHIYAAIAGPVESGKEVSALAILRSEPDDELYDQHDDLYGAILEEIIAANYDVDLDGGVPETLAETVSDLTEQVMTWHSVALSGDPSAPQWARDQVWRFNNPTSSRVAALGMLDRTIETIEARHEDARLSLVEA